MSFIKEHIEHANFLTEIEKQILIDMLNNVLVNDNELDLIDIFDKLIENKTKTERYE